MLLVAAWFIPLAAKHIGSRQNYVIPGVIIPESQCSDSLILNEIIYKCSADLLTSVFFLR